MITPELIIQTSTTLIAGLIISFVIIIEVHRFGIRELISKSESAEGDDLEKVQKSIRTFDIIRKVAYVYLFGVIILLSFSILSAIRDSALYNATNSATLYLFSISISTIIGLMLVLYFMLASAEVKQR
jgi:hypothetical protein